MTGHEEKQLDTILKMVGEETIRATKRFAKFNSPHEGYAVILEEVDELWHEVKHGNSFEQEEEAVQVGAMAMRFVMDCCRKKESDG